MGIAGVEAAKDAVLQDQLVMKHSVGHGTIEDDVDKANAAAVGRDGLDEWQPTRAGLVRLADDFQMEHG
jgi:hypothetical protein